MDEGSLGFAKEMVAAFGEDRFYHALMRPGSYREAKAFYEALGGSNWDSRAHEIKLRFGAASIDMGNSKMDDKEASQLPTR